MTMYMHKYLFNITVKLSDIYLAKQNLTVKIPKIIMHPMPKNDLLNMHGSEICAVLTRHSIFTLQIIIPLNIVLFLNSKLNSIKLYI